MTDRKIHKAVTELREQLRQGKMSRREFLRYSTLLGTSVATAQAFARFGANPAFAEAEKPGSMAAPMSAAEAMPKRGGKLRIASQVHKVTNPAQFSWIAPRNQLANVGEYLTLTDADNITHPYLLESWETSEDLKTWTLKCREGIMFNNGDEFGADDIVFTMGQWLDPDVGSSMLGLMGGYLNPSGIEKVDDYTVILHLESAEIAVPEHLFHYPAMVLSHNTFEGNFLKAPVGTGPYTLEDYQEGEYAKFKRRDGYWKNGADGDPLPYIDELEFIDTGEETSAMISAMQDGEVDVIDVGDLDIPEFYLALKDDPNVNVQSIPSGNTRVLRMRVDVDPWTDPNVRMALKLCQNREKILKLAYFDQGIPGDDAHVYPGHPEYCEKPLTEYNPEKAKQLLVDAGYPDGLEVDIAVGTGWADIVSYAEILKEDAEPAGFKINIDTMPNSQYWDVWTEVGLGITTWAHRPLGTMILNLGYTSDEDGEPVAWNETRWVDEEFDGLLREANGTLDVDKRREIFCTLQDIQMERGSIGITYWRNTWAFSQNYVQNIEAHPTKYLFADVAWLDK